MQKNAEAAGRDDIATVLDTAAYHALRDAALIADKPEQAAILLSNGYPRLVPDPQTRFGSQVDMRSLHPDAGNIIEAATGINWAVALAEPEEEIEITPRGLQNSTRVGGGRTYRPEEALVVQRTRDIKIMLGAALRTISTGRRGAKWPINRN